MVDSESPEEPKVRGVVREVGMERDEDQFRAFNLKIGIIVKGAKSLNYDEGERLMRQFRKDLLGKEVEILSVLVKCPICGKGFNSEQGVKQHLRVSHPEEKKKKTGKPKPAGAKTKKTSKQPKKIKSKTPLKEAKPRRGEEQ